MRLSSILTAAALVAVGTTAFAQSTTLSGQNVGARIVSPITITKNNGSTPQVEGQDLYFGRMVAPGTAGTITLTPANTASFTGGLSATFGNTTPRYDITATDGMVLSVTIVFPPNVANGPTNTMTLSAPTFTENGAAGAGSASGGTFTWNTNDYIRIGGTLAVAANQPVGLYTNTYSITVAYN